MRALLKAVLTIVIILVIVLFLVQTPYVQNIIRAKAEKYLSRKLNTRVEIGYLYVGFPRTVLLRNIYIADRQKDTLLSARLIHVDMSMWELIHSRIDVRELQLGDLTLKVKRNLPDTAFNFQFIADAFAGKQPRTPSPKDSSGMKISLQSLLLDHIRLVYKDTVTGNDDEVWIEHSQTRIDRFDPSANQYQIAAFTLKGLKARIVQGQPLLSTKPGTTSSPFPLQIGKIELESSSLDYRNTVSAIYASLQLGHLSTDIKKFDLSNGIVGLNELRLDSTNVQFDNDRQLRQSAGMDYGHLKITGLSLHGADLNYSNGAFSGHLAEGSFKERSGFELDSLRTDFLYAGDQAYLKNLDLRTPGTVLQRDILIKYSSPAALAGDPVHTLVDLDLRNSKVQVKDILSFVPSLRKQSVFKHPADTWQINTRIKGNLASLRVETLQVSGIGDLKIDLAGSIQHLTDSKRMAADLNIRNASGSKASLASLLPPGTLPPKINIPAQFNLHGKIKGGMNNVVTDLVINSSSGNIAIKGTINDFKDAANAGYDATVQTQGLDLGYILKDKDQWGLVTANFTVSGRGFDPQHANAKLTGTINAAVIKHYDYRNFQFDASIADRHVELQSSIRDPAIRFHLNASADLANKFPAVKLDWQIDTLDMRALHLMKDTLQFKGHLVADFTSTNPDSLQGNLKIAGISLVSGGHQLTTDSIVLVAKYDAGREDIRLHSEMADMDLNGRYKISEIGQALQQSLDKYYRFNTASAEAKFSPQDWQMHLTLRPSPIVLANMPSLKGTDSIGVQASFNSDRNDLHLALNAPRIQYGKQLVNRIGFRASTGDKGLEYSLQMAGATGSGFELHQTSLEGRLADNHLFASLLLKDEKSRDKYRVAGQLDRLGNGTKFILNPDSLLLNYDKWLVSRDNYLQYDPAGLIINDFKISNKGESMQINSRPPAPSSPIDVAFTDFRLSTLSRFAEQDSSLVDGLLNGKAEIKNLLSTPVFTSDLQIKGLTYKRDTVGDLVVKVNNEKGNAYTADISLEGNRNDVRIKGDYYTGESRTDLKLDLRELNLAALKPFLVEQLQDIRGSLKGSLAITGSFDKPGINGRLHFDSTLITPVISGEPLKLSNDNIEFDADGFNFSQFSLLDSAGNKATIDGNVFTKDYKDWDVDLTLNANNFRLVNAPQASNRLFYGKLNLDAAVNIKGDPLDALSVDGDIRVNKKTDFDFVLPTTTPEVVDRLGVIRFVDKDHPSDTLVDKAALALASRNSEIKGFDVSLTIETDSSAVLTMVLDERNGDALTTRGRSNLVFAMDKSGKTSLTGGYEVEGGSYNLSLKVMKRKFIIGRGSTITWTGDPTSAILDVNASYTANTPSIDLIENEIAARSQADINKFRQKLPFLVTLKMEGELLKPKITFDISLPTEVLTLWPDVDARLQQIRVEESELNKQVFALLLLNRFVGEDPLQSAAGGGISVANIGFQTASQILTSQMDQLAASLIKGVDVHFDLNKQQDFSTGVEQDYTELNVSVSKQLFNERVQVNVGSNFDVQGAGGSNRSASNIAGDAAVDYKLTQDGRYMIRAYRKNQYEAVVEGEVVETGVGFILTFDYDKFKEIFGRTKVEGLEARTLPGTGKSAATGAGKTTTPVTPSNNGGTPSNK